MSEQIDFRQISDQAAENYGIFRYVAELNERGLASHKRDFDGFQRNYEAGRYAEFPGAEEQLEKRRQGLALAVAAAAEELEAIRVESLKDFQANEVAYFEIAAVEAHEAGHHFNIDHPLHNPS